MSKYTGCYACQFYAHGGKSRIALKHTCGKLPAKTFKLPKFDNAEWVEFVIQRGEIYQGEKITKFKCQKQEINGVTIPQGFEVIVPYQAVLGVENEFSSRPLINVRGWKANDILKTIVMEGLRNG